jgi:parallel beta-helix repeat protein
MAEARRAARAGMSPIRPCTPECREERNVTKPLMAILALLGTLGLTVLEADEGRIPVYLPGTITHPGHYVLTRNIAITGGIGILINASDVTLDLNGLSVSSSSIAGTLIYIADGQTDVTIHGGSLHGGGAAVFYQSTSTPTRMRLEDLSVSGTGGTALYVQDAERVDVLSCQLDGSGGIGVYVDGYSGTFSGRFEDDSILGPALSGFYLASLRNGVLRRNSIFNPGANNDGIRLTGSLAGTGGNIVEENRVTVQSAATGITGITVDSSSNHNLLRENLVQGATVRGFFVSGSENRVEQNVAVGSTGDGISISGDRNHLDGNLASLNTSCGLRFLNTNAHAWSNNVLRGNASGQEVCNGGAPNTNAGGNVCDAGFCP